MAREGPTLPVKPPAPIAAPARQWTFLSNHAHVLVCLALDRGYTCLEAETLAENLNVSAWARRFGFSVRTEPGSGGLVKVTLELEQLLPVG